MIPASFVERIAILAAAAGHVGVKVAGTAGHVSAAVAVEQFFQRIGNVRVACAKKDAASGSAFAEILVAADGGFQVVVDEACSGRYSDFWQGRSFSGDRTIAGLVPVSVLGADPFLGYASDPFVMQNLASFLGQRGRQLVARLRQDDPMSVIAVVVGPPDEAFFFAEAEVLRHFVPLLFSRCRYTEQYTNYARGSFAPIELALRQISRSGVSRGRR